MATFVLVSGARAGEGLLSRHFPTIAMPRETAGTLMRLAA